MNQLKEIAEFLLKNDDFTIVGHAMPDGDCVGSVLGLSHGLKQMGKSVQVVLQDTVPSIYAYLAGADMIKTPDRMETRIENLIYLDCGDEDRVGDDLLLRLTERKLAVNIDHHQANSLFADYNYVDTSAAATAEIIYSLLQALRAELTPEISAALLAGIIMDTGSFMNSNTTGDSLRAAASLLEHGADIDQARINLFESKSRAEILLLGRALNSMSFNENGQIAWMTLTYEELKNIGALDINPEGIINYARSVEGVKIALLFREVEPHTVKIGFRSKPGIDVAALARHFGGGGHKQAAGARQKGSLVEVTRLVLEAAKDVMA